MVGIKDPTPTFAQHHLADDDDFPSDAKPIWPEDERDKDDDDEEPNRTAAHTEETKAQPQSGSADAKQSDSATRPSHNPLHSLTSAFHDLKTRLKGKSHRFSDLLHLHHEVVKDLSDSEVYPELDQDAHLRRDNSLSDDESAFLRARKERIAQSGALQRFLSLPPEEVVQPDDVPIIALGGSGGGYRACLGFLAAIEEMQHSSSSADEDSCLFDLVSYVGGVSGSCWTLGALYTFAALDARWLLTHFSQSSSKHPLSMRAIDAVARSASGVYFQLGPLLQKLKIGHLHPGPLDLYGTLVTSHIFFSPLSPPAGVVSFPPRPGTQQNAPASDGRDQRVEERQAGHTSDAASDTPPRLLREWFQFSRCFERMGIDRGLSPLPLLTAIRHERPWKDWKSETEAFDHTSDHTADEHKDPHAWWQWFEFSPIEFGSDELAGWIPTWAFGRQFDKGVSTQRLPERSLSLILSLATSAPAGPLAAWLGTIYRNLPKNAFGQMVRSKADTWVEKHPEQAERLQSHHPIHAQNEANPFFHAEVVKGRGNGFENSPRIHLVDAGMSNNLPLYSFFRPHRHVDVALLGDYSSDVQSGEALQRIRDFGDVKGLRVELRGEALAPLPEWPTEDDEEGKPQRKQLSSEEIAERFKGRYAQVLDAIPVAKEEGEDEDHTGNDDNVQPANAAGKPSLDEDVSKCKRWPDGLLYNRRHQPQAQSRCTLVYLPLLPHACQPEYDPSTAAFSSSYNLVWTEEQVGTIRKTSRADIAEAMDTIRDVIREAYERKRAERLARGRGEPSHA